MSGMGGALGIGDEYKGIQDFNLYRKNHSFLRTLDEDIMLTAKRFNSAMDKIIDLGYKILGFGEEEMEYAIRKEENKIQQRGTW